MPQTKTADGVSVDRTVGALETIGVGHAEVHNGEMFAISQVVAATTDYLFTAPAGKTLHLCLTAVADGAGANKVELFPGVTTSAAGSAFSQVFNCNRASSATAGVTITTGPTVTSTLDATTCMFSGSLAVAGVVAGTLDRDQGEFILAAGSKNLIRITRAAGNITLQARWYEE